MERLKVKDIITMVNVLVKERGMALADVMDLPVYIGDDDELNGIHCGWECRIVDADDTEDEYYVEMINERSGNYELTGNNSAILIA